MEAQADSVPSPAETVTGRAPQWAIHLQPCGPLLVDRATLYYVRLGGSGADLALQIARTGSLEGAAHVRSAVDGVSFALVRADLKAALEAHPITAAWADGILGRSMRVTGSTEAFLPLQCSLQLTNSCNLRCLHCYASSGRAYPDELTTSDWMAVMQRLATHGVAAVTLTGGEPTIARDFRHILSAAASLFENVDVYTNGLSWSGADVELAAVLGNVRVQVSVDGRREHHDTLRGMSGSYASALETIRRLASTGVAVFVAMSTTPDNWCDVAGLIEDVAAVGAVSFRAGRTLPVGRGTSHEYSLTAEQAREVQAQLASAHETTGIHVEGWEACSNATAGLEQTGLPMEFCTPGYLTWHIRADGGVTPCQIEAASFGHILNDPMIAIGAPERLETVRGVARSCRCLNSIELPRGEDALFAVKGR